MGSFLKVGLQTNMDTARWEVPITVPCQPGIARSGLGKVWDAVLVLDLADMRELVEAIFSNMFLELVDMTDSSRSFLTINWVGNDYFSWLLSKSITFLCLQICQILSSDTTHERLKQITALSQMPNFKNHCFKHQIKHSATLYILTLTRALVKCRITQDSILKAKPHENNYLTIAQPWHYCRPQLHLLIKTTPIALPVTWLIQSFSFYRHERHGGNCDIPGQACIICGILGSWIPGTFFPRHFYTIYAIFTRFYAIFTQFYVIFTRFNAIFAIFTLFFARQKI